MPNIDKSKLIKKSDKDDKSVAELTKNFEVAVQAKLNAQAVSMGYDSIVTAVSYADEPAVPRFQQEGRALRQWRSLVWQYCYAELAKVKSGERQIPTWDVFAEELPALEAPSDAAP